MLLCAVTTWAADFTLSNGSSNTLNWTSDGSSTCAPWANTAVTENLPSALSGKTVTKAESTVTINEAGVITVTFQYTGGDQRLDMDGVDLIDGSGNVVASDYHHGYTGTNKDGNVYTLVVNATGDYTLRYWVTQGDYLYKTNGTITVFYENTAVYERRVAVERITPVIENIRGGLGAIEVTADKLSTNGAISGSAGSLANLIDGDNTTEFVTTWLASVGESHYIQVDLGTEDLGMEEFSLMWVNRSNGRDGLYAGNIKASTDGSSWDILKEIADGEVSKAASAKIQIDGLSLKNSSDAQYRYIRLTCTYGQYKLAADNEYCFGLAEFTVKGTLSAEEQQLSDLCDAAQAVIDDVNSTAADINEQYKNLKLATVEKPTYPFTLTTDDENPVLYVIKSGRDGNPSFTLTNDGYISLTAFTGEDSQVWYFKEVVNADYEYVLNIIPYAAPTTTMGYSSTTDNPAMVSNSSSNTCNEWVLDQSFSILGIKPYERQSTYLSNNGGAGNKMGFWWQDPVTDPGTALYITLATEEINTMLNDLITTAESCNAGTKVGDYTETAIAGLQPTITDVKAVKENATATYDEKVAAFATLNTAINSLEIILPEEGKFYKLVSNNSGYSNGRKAYVKLTDNKAYWDNAETAMDDTDTRAIWQFELLGDNNVAIKNVHTNSYLSVAGHNETFAALGETKGTFEVKHLADGVVGLGGVGGEDIHAPQYNGQALLAWNSSSATGASAWVVEEVAAPTHTLTVGAAGYTTLVLGYNATVPAIEGEGNGVFTATVNGEWIDLTAVAAGSVLPANTAVIIKAAAGTELSFAYSAETAAEVTTALLGTLYDKNVAPGEGNTAYVLSMQNEVVGFYKAALNQDENTAFKNNANKAYLVVEGAELAAYSFRFPGTTGIEEITDNREQSTVIYDLTGRRVEAITAPGIYIVNGKKTLVK